MKHCSQAEPTIRAHQRRFLSVLLVGAIAAASSASNVLAAEARAEEARAAADLDDVQDLLFLGPLRPVWIRLHIQVNRQSFRKVWRDNFHKLFIVADVNRDGVLDAKQPPKPADGKPPPQLSEIDAFAASAAAYLDQEATQAMAALKQLASEQEGRLSESALLAYAEQVAPPFAIAPRAASQNRLRVAMTPAPALFPLLDVDGDQTLTAEELAAAEERLANRDFNEDEVISPRELMVAPDASLAAATEPVAERQTILPGVGPLFLLAREEPPARVADALLERYDADGDRQLKTGAGGEIDLVAARLNGLDSDGDGQLSRDELIGFAAQGPDVELTCTIGSGSYVPRAQRKKLVHAKVLIDGPDVKAPRNGFDLALGDAALTLRTNHRDPSQNNADGPELRNFDSDGNGYLEPKEVKDNPELAAAFVSLDLDGNGKLFADEFQLFAQRQQRGAASRLLLEVTDGGQQLLGVLDAVPDSVLSLRELRSAAEALSRGDMNGDGRLAGNEIPSRVQIDLSRNTPAGARTMSQQPMTEERELSASPTGPVWFQKLDRNRDGDLSRREFVGPAEIFDRLDRDHDGLVSAEEAEAAEK